MSNTEQQNGEPLDPRLYKYRSGRFDTHEEGWEACGGDGWFLDGNTTVGQNTRRRRHDWKPEVPDPVDPMAAQRAEIERGDYVTWVGDVSKIPGGVQFFSTLGSHIRLPASTRFRTWTAAELPDLSKPLWIKTGQLKAWILVSLVTSRGYGLPSYFLCFGKVSSPVRWSRRPDFDTAWKDLPLAGMPIGPALDEGGDA